MLKPLVYQYCAQPIIVYYYIGCGNGKNESSEKKFCRWKSFILDFETFEKAFSKVEKAKMNDFQRQNFFSLRAFLPFPQPMW